jgi:hypothetical protein
MTRAIYPPYAGSDYEKPALWSHAFQFETCLNERIAQTYAHTLTNNPRIYPPPYLGGRVEPQSEIIMVAFWCQMGKSRKFIQDRRTEIVGDNCKNASLPK